MRGTLGTIGFIARLAPTPPYCGRAVLRSVFPLYFPFLSHRAPCPVSRAKGVASYYAYEYAYVPCEHSTVEFSGRPVASPAW